MNTGLAKTRISDERDVFFDELELGSSDNKTRWGMSDSDIAKLRVDNQRRLPTCVGQTASKMMEHLTGKDYSARYVYTNTDKIYEASNKGGLHVANMFKFMTTFGIVNEELSEDNNRLSFQDYYNNTPTVVDLIKKPKEKLGAYMLVNTNVEAIKKALDTLDVLAVAVWRYRTKRTRVGGKRITQFTYDKNMTEGHAMKITHMEKVNGKHHLYLFNSWGDGQAMLVLEDFPTNVIQIHGGTVKKEIVKKVKEVVKVKKEKYPKLENFTYNELKDISLELALDLQGIRNVTKELTQKYNLHKRGIPMIINSGKRSLAHNKRVGGVPDSEHLTGDGVDVRALSGSEKMLLVQAVSIYYFREGVQPRLGVSWKSGFIHIGIGLNKPKPTMWTY